MERPGMRDDHFQEARKDALIGFLHRIIRQAVRVLAALMVFVIVWGIGDVLWILFQKLTTPPHFLLNINEIYSTFGAFLAVLIAIEIFVNITLYLRDDVFHVKLVIATALMAIARKVIALDYATVDPAYVYATGVTVLALGVTYWLVATVAKI